MLTQAEVKALARIYNQSRDFCGNPLQAIREWEYENKELTFEDFIKVQTLANQLWEESKP